MIESFPRASSFRISDLFDQLVTGLISAQNHLDANAVGQRVAFLHGPGGSMSVPPLWFHFSRVRFELEVRAVAVERGGAPTLTCRLPDPLTSGLTETNPFTRSRISVMLEPITRLSAEAAD